MTCIPGDLSNVSATTKTLMHAHNRTSTRQYLRQHNHTHLHLNRLQHVQTTNWPAVLFTGRANGQRCNVKTQCLSGICKGGKCIGKSLGSPCTDNRMCKSNICMTVGQKSVCSLKAPGAYCLKGKECSSNTCYEHKCECASSCVFGTSCLTGCPADKTCLYLPNPYANYCGDKKPLGGICHANEECTSGVCRDYECTVKAPGEYCTSSAECGRNCYGKKCQCLSGCTYSANCPAGCPKNQACIFSSSSADYCH